MNDSGKLPPEPKPDVNTITGANSARAAATDGENLMPPDDIVAAVGRLLA